MPDTKITALAAITTVDPAADVLPIVDISDTSMAASGTTKKITSNQILGAGGTATLASATITGDLTVRTNKLAVTSTGVGIGTATLFGDLNIQNGTNCRFELGSAAGGTVIENLNNARNAYLDMTMYADAYIWNRLGSEVMRLNSTGLGVGVVPSAGKGALQLSSGINFPATQVASSDANTLDDYEEGTWTIGLTFGGGSTGITTGANTGRYTKIGRQVTVIGYLSLTNKGSSTGSASITGLPFAIPNIGEAFCAASLRIDNLSYVGSPQALGLIGNTKIELEQVSEAGTATALTNSNFSNSSGIIFTLTYTV